MSDGPIPGSTPGSGADSAAPRRARMVAALARRGIADRRVLWAMGRVPRHRYIDPSQDELAYDDRPVAIGSGQTISQPYIVALMAEAAEVEPSDRVLEVGTGSGYGAAVLACLAGRVWTIERHRELADVARARLERDGYDNVTVIVGDGSRGWPPAAPFQAIVVTACPRTIPRDLLDQLDDGGRLIIPVGQRRRIQTLVRVRRLGDELTRDDLGPVRFVPLISD
ncbi:MAG: protein-L-isoaspartate(D-aspartate) O-methyltransferase [Acidimicrobiia bacterium]|nr:protein-L-isoaspartate(D-aspartate) O-methyltransferase [Acidimicrobiia bacterium]